MTRYWEFAQLSDHFKDVNLLDPVARTQGRLYIGGIGALYREDPDPLKLHNITHILSVLDFDITPQRNLDGYTHLWVQVDDEAGENLLKSLERTNVFIESALAAGGNTNILVHCSMGVSRSATVVCAYLMKASGLSPKAALEQIQEGRPRCQPNPGFMRQLDVYENMLQAKDEAAAAHIYEKWLQEQGRGPNSASDQAEDVKSKL